MSSERRKPVRELLRYQSTAPAIATSATVATARHAEPMPLSFVKTVVRSLVWKLGAASGIWRISASGWRTIVLRRLEWRLADGA